MKTETSMQLSSKKAINNLRIEIREITKDEVFINIIFYNTGKSSLVNNDLEIYSRMRFSYLKEELHKSEHRIHFEEVDAGKHTQFLLESITNSKLKIILFGLGLFLIGVLFWYEQVETGSLASLSVILYIVYCI